jgi:hypothetical protein
MAAGGIKPNLKRLMKEEIDFAQCKYLPDQDARRGVV